MLTKELAIVAFENGRVIPDRLTRETHRAYLQFAERMLRVYRSGVGRTRRELHNDVHAVFAQEHDCPLRRIGAFCKLLDDASCYEKDKRGYAAELRRKVFRLAASLHPLVTVSDRLFETDERAAKRAISQRLRIPWEEIDRNLFADVIEFQRLEKFEGFTSPEGLLSRYNVAQIQVALFGASEMSVWATQDFKTVLRHAKLARLMHTIRRSGPDRYVIRFDGPASLLRETRRYGVAMARFIPALLACNAWRMHAIIRHRGWSNRLELSSQDGLSSHLPSPDYFDSKLEQRFAQRWGAASRDGWCLVREGVVLQQNQKVFIPDFVFRHEDGRSVLMEIVGFWTPEYLQAKVETLRTFRSHRILLAVPESVHCELPASPQHVIRFKTSLKIKDVLEKLEQLATGSRD